MTEVAALRESAGLTQAELARRSGIAQPNISAYEAGRRIPTAATLRRLRLAASGYPRDALKIHRDELLAIAARHGLEDVRVFGSVARRNDRPDSDVDLLVRAPRGTGLLTISAFSLEVERLLGTRVDVVTDGGLRQGHPIGAEAIPL